MPLVTGVYYRSRLKRQDTILDFSVDENGDWKFRRFFSTSLALRCKVSVSCRNVEYCSYRRKHRTVRSLGGGEFLFVSALRKEKPTFRFLSVFDGYEPNPQKVESITTMVFLDQDSVINGVNVGPCK